MPTRVKDIFILLEGRGGFGNFIAYKLSLVEGSKITKEDLHPSELENNERKQKLLIDCFDNMQFTQGNMPVYYVYHNTKRIRYNDSIKILDQFNSDELDSKIENASDCFEIFMQKTEILKNDNIGTKNAWELFKDKSCKYETCDLGFHTVEEHAKCMTMLSSYNAMQAILANYSVEDRAIITKVIENYKEEEESRKFREKLLSDDKKAIFYYVLEQGLNQAYIGASAVSSGIVPHVQKDLEGEVGSFLKDKTKFMGFIGTVGMAVAAPMGAVIFAARLAITAFGQALEERDYEVQSKKIDKLTKLASRPSDMEKITEQFATKVTDSSYSLEIIPPDQTIDKKIQYVISKLKISELLIKPVIWAAEYVGNRISENTSENIDLETIKIIEKAQIILQLVLDRIMSGDITIDIRQTPEEKANILIEDIYKLLVDFSSEDQKQGSALVGNSEAMIQEYKSDTDAENKNIADDSDSSNKKLSLGGLLSIFACTKSNSLKSDQVNLDGDMNNYFDAPD